MKTYELYCGNLDCPTRTEMVGDTEVANSEYAAEARPGRRFRVPADDLPDGEVWVCPECYRKQTA